MIALKVPRGVAERAWALENSYGTKAEFNAYLKDLPAEKREVCWNAAVGNSANTPYQEFQQQAVIEAGSTSAQNKRKVVQHDSPSL